MLSKLADILTIYKFAIGDCLTKCKQIETVSETAETAIVDERTIRDKIYVVRGVQVMLDFELAELYGYTTTAFNQQVKNNAEKFEGDDFSFQLTREEFNDLMSKKLISSWGGRRKLPKVYTESGVYMLMTVLRGPLAIQQSRALIRTFRAMKDFIVENKNLITQRDYLRLSIQQHMSGYPQSAKSRMAASRHRRNILRI